MIQILILSVIMLTSPALGLADADVDINVVQTFKLDAKPVDVAMSLNGNRIFALTDSGYLLMYAPDGQLMDRVPVGKGMDIIRTTPREDVLLIGNSMEKTLQVITLDMTQTIDTTGRPFKGPADAPVEVVVFSDFECPSCADLASLLDQVLIENPETVKVVFMNYPLRIHRYSRLAAAAAMVAGMQGRFWEFHDLLFDNYDQISPQKITEISRELKLDEERLKRDINKPEVAEALYRDTSEAARLGLDSTPTVFVNGRVLRDRSMKSFQTVIEEQLGASAKK